MSWEFKKNQIQSPFEIIFNLELFGFYSNYFSPKIKYVEIRVKSFPTVEKWREINSKLFWYFKNIFIWFLLKPVALFASFKFLWTLFDARKMFIL